jgi:hypothetical protein
MKLTELGLPPATTDKDLFTLKGMPLKSLTLAGTAVDDLTPLQGMKLESVVFTPQSITRGLDVLRQMKTLQTIGVQEVWQIWPAAEFWKKYDAGDFKK